MTKMVRLAKTALSAALIAAGAAIMPIETSAMNTPSTLTASRGTYSEFVYISWSSVSGAQGYRIKRSTSPNYSTATTLKDVSSSVGGLYDYSAAAGRTYYYWVLPSDGAYWWYTANKYAQGYRASASTSSSTGSSTSAYSISGNSSVKVGSTITLTFGSKSADWYLSNPNGVLQSKSGKSVKLTGLAPGDVTVYAVYKGSTYSKTITVTSDYNGNTSANGNSGGCSISGNNTLRAGKSAKYYLYVGGKKVTSKSVAWSRSGLATMQDKGSYGLLKATIKPATTNKVTVRADYSGRHAQKTVTITR